MTYRRFLTLSLSFSLSFPSFSQQLHIEHIRTVNVNAPITSGSFNALQKSLAVVVGEKTIRILDVETLADRTSLTGIPSRVLSVMFGPDGRTTFSAMTDGKVAITDIASNKITKLLTPHAAAVVAMDLDRGSLLFTAGFDRVIKISDATSGNSLGTVPAGQDEPTSLLAAPSGEYFVVGTAAGVLKVYNLSNLAAPRLITTGTERIAKLAFNQQGNALLVGTASGSVRVLETATWTTLHSSRPHAGSIMTMGYELKSRWFYTSGADSVVRFFDAASFDQIGMTKEGNGIGTFATFVSDEMFVVGTSKGDVTTWKILDVPPDSLPPAIVLRLGADAREGDTLRHFGKEFRLEGHVYDQSKIKEVRLNDTPITFVDLDETERAGIQEDSHAKKFSALVPLSQVGLNVLQINAVDDFGNSSSSALHIYRLSRDEALEIITPANDTETEGVSIELKMRPWFDVVAYSLSVNLVDVSNQRTFRRAKGAAIRDEIPLVAGYNQVQIAVVSSEGERFTKTLGITKKIGSIPSMASTTGSSSPKEKTTGPQRWAVVVGVSEYASTGIPSLKYADRDALAFADFLRTEGGGAFDEEHLRVLVNKDATITNIRDALINFLSQAIDMDLVIIYFAGHGAPEPARPNNLYLLAHDTDPNLLGTTAFPMWQIQDVLARYISAKRIVVFSDACHSGGISVAYATRGLAVTESNLINQYLSDLSRSKEGVVVFTASAAGEVSQEYPELSHGAFTYYLLDGLRGAADFNNDKTVTINEAMQYVEEQVKRKTRGAQNPTRSQTAYDKDLTLSVLPD